MRISHRRVQIEIEQTTVRLQWGDGQIPPDGGHQMVADLLEASKRLLDAGDAALHEAHESAERDP